MTVEVDDRLASDTDIDGGDIEGALELLDEKRGTPILICSSKTRILELLEAFGVGGGASDSLHCQKGSTWVIELRSGRLHRAEYVSPREAPRGKRRAVLDVGSTSISLLVADVGPGKGRIQPVHRARAELRLGASPDEVGAADADRAVKLARTLRAEAEEAEAEELVAVASASLRNASNGEAVAERLSEVLDSPLRILSAEEEAELVYHAARRRLGFDGQTTLVVDLGGGSLDFALGRGAKILHAASEPIGVTRLQAELVSSDPMRRGEVNAIRERVRECLEPHLEKLTGRGLLRCVASGGTVRTLASLVLARRGRDDESVVGMSILRKELETLAHKLRRASHAERIVIPGIRPERADLLPTGAIVLTAMLERLDLSELGVCDWGLREGVLLERAESRVIRL
jgi:exopolyphosphatase/guanosine-5'-triphosphate,3'-diphosphate pyrophosphatase